MRQCPLCLSIYPDVDARCRRDDAPLLPSDPLLGIVLADKYKLNAFVGAGAMGRVYRATQMPLARTVAVKIIQHELVENSQAIRRFKREALAVARLRHPSIVAIYDFGTAPDLGAFLVLEYLEGQSLERTLQMCDHLSFAEAVDIVRQVCLAVHASHEAGVLHRDLKPHNLFIERDADGPKVKILDFGIAKLFANPERGDPLSGPTTSGASTSHGALTIQGVVIGTPIYMSPEQGIGDPLDARSDVYSIGCVLYEALTGDVPFRGKTSKATLLKKVRGAFVPARTLDPSLPDGIDDVLARALAPQVEHRFASAAEFEAALAKLVSGTTGPLTPPPTKPGDETQSLRRPGLPQPVTAIVGRDEHATMLVARLGQTRCLTLTGPGGVGKTRLALELAHKVLDAWPDGVCFVDLVRLNAPGAVASNVADALGLREERDRPLAAVVHATVADRRMLFVLDNCERVIAECSTFASALLAACPHVGVLATSREPLRVEGESVWRVPPLRVEPAPTRSPDGPRVSDAMRLFADRAHFASPAFALTSANSPVVAEICRRLEGLPLAIELAAACVKLLSVDQILEKLADRFRLLVGGGRTATVRHRTLRATIDWSYNLLAGDEQQMLERLSVFSRGFTAEAAQAICSGEQIDALAVLDLIDRLIDKSLVIEERSGSDARYQMLDMVWEYARERLSASGELEPLQRAHRDWYLELAEEARDALSGPDQAFWLGKLEVELENVRGALAWSIHSARDADVSLRLAASIYRFWDVHGYQIEGIHWLEAALALSGDIAPTLEADALFGLAILNFTLGDYPATRTHVERCVAIHREANRREDVARALNLYALVAGYQGDFDLATDVQKESLTLSRELDLTASINQGTFHLGLLAMQRGDLQKADLYLGESVVGWSKAGNRLAAAGATLNLAEVARLQGDMERSLDLLEDVGTVAKEMSAKPLIAACLVHKGQVLGMHGEYATAFSTFERALAIYRESGSREGLAMVLEACVVVASLGKRPKLAVKLAAAATAAREAMRSPLDPTRSAEIDGYVAAARAAVSREEAAVAWQSGRTLTLDAALDLAFANR